MVKLKNAKFTVVQNPALWQCGINCLQHDFAYLYKLFGSQTFKFTLQNDQVVSKGWGKPNPPFYHNRSEISK